MSTALTLPDFLTVDAFLRWEAPMGQLWQLVDGAPQAMAPASPTHAAILGEVAAVLRNHLTLRKEACFVMVAPGVVPRV